MGLLIDFSAEPDEVTQQDSRGLPKPNNGVKSNTADINTSNVAARKAPPPRPAKPLALRSSPSDVGTGASASADKNILPPPPNPRARKASGPQASSASHPLAQIQNSSDQSVGSSVSASRQQQQQPPPPPPRRRATPSSSQVSLNLTSNRSPSLRPQALSRSSSNLDLERLDSLPDAAYRQSSSSSPTPASAVNKKLDLWRRRLARAQDTLDRHGVALYTWRKGSDVAAEAEGIVMEAMKGLRGRSSGKRK